MARRPTESEFGGTTPTEKQREKTEKPKYKFGDAPKVAKQLFGEKEEGAIEGPKDLSRVREIEQEAAGELAADERRAEVAALGDKAAKKGAKKAEKELSKDVRGLKKEAKKAERQDKKGAEEASYSTNKGAEAAVEDVAESVTETVSGGAPATTIKPAGRVEEMSLRQLRERERGAGVGGLLGMGGARGDVRRGIRQGTIHTEEGQESLAALQEAREARQEAQQAKREARAVLRGGEYTPRDPSGFRAMAQDVASRATAAGDVLTEEAAPASEPRASEATPDPVNPYSSGDAGYSEDPELELSPVSRIEEEQFSEDPELALPPLEQSYPVDETELAGEVAEIMGNPSDGTPILDTLVDRSAMTFPIERLHSAVLAGRISAADAREIAGLLKRAGYSPTRRGEIV